MLTGLVYSYPRYGDCGVRVHWRASLDTMPRRLMYDIVKIDKYFSTILSVDTCSVLSWVSS